MCAGCRQNWERENKIKKLETNKETILPESYFPLY